MIPPSLWRKGERRHYSLKRTRDSPLPQESTKIKEQQQQTSSQSEKPVLIPAPLPEVKNPIPVKTPINHRRIWEDNSISSSSPEQNSLQMQRELFPSIPIHSPLQSPSKTGEIEYQDHR